MIQNLHPGLVVLEVFGAQKELPQKLGLYPRLLAFLAFALALALEWGSGERVRLYGDETAGNDLKSNGKNFIFPPPPPHCHKLACYPCWR